jgi:hypothetical protein
VPSAPRITAVGSANVDLVLPVCERLPLGPYAGLVALTLDAEGAVSLEVGREVARARALAACRPGAQAPLPTAAEVDAILGA